MDTFCPRGGASIKIPFKGGCGLKLSKYITGMEIQQNRIGTKDLREDNITGWVPPPMETL